MGEVWRALDPALDRQVAIKILPSKYSSDQDRLQRFEQEARAAGMLNHPNVLAVYAVGKQEVHLTWSRNCSKERRYGSGLEAAPFRKRKRWSMPLRSSAA
jgi:serine/threonine protein kinase